MIYDTFMFFNELELLELRLNELNGVVDKFVLVEATRTFTNKPKPLYYAENKQRFSQFNDKIIHIVVDDSPDSNNPWVLDRYQKNCVGRGLRNAVPDDIIMFSDADEIPKAETVRCLTKTLKYDKGVIADLCHNFFKSKMNQKLFGKTLRKINPYVYVLEQSISAHFINLLLVDKSKWLGTRVCFYRDFTLADEIRYTGYKIIHDGGWHFTWMGGVERARLKLQSFAHNEYNKPEFLDEKNILNAIQNQKFFLDDKIKLKPVPLDNSFPDYILKHPERFPGWVIPVK